MGQDQLQGSVVDDKELFEQSREEEKNDGVRPYDESEALTPNSNGNEKRDRPESNQLTLVTSRSETSSDEPILQDFHPRETKSPKGQPRGQRQERVRTLAQALEIEAKETFGQRSEQGLSDAQENTEAKDMQSEQESSDDGSSVVS